jgi:hypothetical protein
VGNEVLEQVDEWLLVKSDNELSNDLLLSFSVKRGREAFVRVGYSRLRVVVFDPIISEWVVDFLLREFVQVMVALVDAELIVDLTLYLALDATVVLCPATNVVEEHAESSGVKDVEVLRLQVGFVSLQEFVEDVEVVLMEDISSEVMQELQVLADLDTV